MADEPVKLTLGQAFDVTATRRRTSPVHGSDKSYGAGDELRLRTAKDQDVTVSETLPDDWHIIEKSDPHQKATASRVRWSLTVPARDELPLTCRVLTRF